jgi:hypothetical protein
VAPATRPIHLRRLGAGLAAAVVANAFLVVGPLPGLFGLELQPELSGVIAPAVSAGSLLVLRTVPARDLRPGDVATFADSASPGRRLTERVITVQPQVTSRTLITSSDSSGAQRSWTVSSGQPVARTERVVPNAGYLAAAIQSPVTAVAAVAVALLLVGLPALSVRRSRVTPIRLP